MAKNDSKFAPLKKSELLKEIAQIADVNGVQCNASQVKIILESYEKVLLKEWKTKGEFKFLNIGKFKIRNTPARDGVNPLTGEKVRYPAKTVPKFTFNKAVKEFILGNLRK